MVTVRLFGTLRLDAGRRQIEVDAATVAEALEKAAAALGLPGSGPLLQAAVYVNGERAGLRTRLKDGDEIDLLSPAAGG